MRLPVMLACATSALMLAPTASDAARSVNLDARTAGQLADLCVASPSNPLNDSRIDFCHGFAQGAVSVMLHDAGEKKPFCFPRPTPTRTQTMTEFAHWARAEPSHASLPAAEGLSQFLAERYPCK